MYMKCNLHSICSNQKA